MPPAIRTEQLTKRYGRRPGIEALDLEVAPGEVFGFIGPNGAGKTTTIRLLLDLLHPTSGRAIILGLDAHRDSVAVRRSIGYLPGEFGLDVRMTGRQLLAYFARLRGLDGLGDAPQLAARLGLDLDVQMGRLSRGNRQKIGLVQALFHRPALLILDEPTTGLDPLVQDSFLQLLREARDEGRTVFLSSHVLSEVERVCDRVAIVRAAHLATLETTESLLEKRRKRVTMVFDRPVDATPFARLAGVSDVTAQGEFHLAAAARRHRRRGQTRRSAHAARPGHRASHAGRGLHGLLRGALRGAIGSATRPAVRTSRRHAPTRGLPAGRRRPRRARMNTVWTLTAHDLRRRLRSLIIWAVVVGALGALYIALYPSMSSMLDEYMQNAPESMRQYMGGIEGSITPEQWMEMEFTGSIIPIALPFLVMLIGARAIAGSEERRMLDLLLSNPVRRRHIVLGAALTMAIALAGVLAVAWILTFIATLASGVDLGAGSLADGSRGALALLPVLRLAGAAALGLHAPGSARHRRRRRHPRRHVRVRRPGAGDRDSQTAPVRLAHLPVGQPHAGRLPLDGCAHHAGRRRGLRGRGNGPVRRAGTCTPSRPATGPPARL